MADLSDNWGREPVGEYHRGAKSSIHASWDSDDEPTRMSWDSDDEPTPMSWDADRRAGIGAALRGLIGTERRAADVLRDRAAEWQRFADDDTDGM